MGIIMYEKGFKGSGLFLVTRNVQCVDLITTTIFTRFRKKNNNNDEANFVRRNNQTRKRILSMNINK